MRAIAGLILSIAAAVLYTIVGIWFATLDPTALLEQIDNFILAIALLPLILLFRLVLTTNDDTPHLVFASF